MVNLDDVKFYFSKDDYLTSDEAQREYLSRMTTRLELYGTDMFTGGSGDIQIQKGDFRLVSGLQNLAQQLVHRLICVKGEHPFDPFLGINWFDYLGVDRFSTPEMKAALLAEELTNEIIKDYRVLAVADVQVTYKDSNAIEVYIEIQPAGAPSDAFGFSGIISPQEGDSY